MRSKIVRCQASARKSLSVDHHKVLQVGRTILTQAQEPLEGQPENLLQLIDPLQDNDPVNGMSYSVGVSMEIEKAPPGQRITRLCFYSATQKTLDGLGRNQFERCEFTLAPTASGEEIGSLWCDITPDFMTVTTMIAPPGFRSDSAQITSTLSALQETTSPNGTVKKGVKKDHSQILSDAINSLLSQVVASVNGIERRQVIYKISEITGAIEMTGYFPQIKIEDVVKLSESKDREGVRA